MPMKLPLSILQEERHSGTLYNLLNTGNILGDQANWLQQFLKKSHTKLNNIVQTITSTPNCESFNL
eukprot:m.39192 g.39192  ORF g.39192 m.39192 type:complete len:66 (+) comp10274_c0_seq1:147-344(+)